MSGKLSIFLPFVALYVLGYTLECVNGQDYSYVYADRMLQFYGRPLQWTWCVDDLGGQLSVTERNRLCGPDEGEIQVDHADVRVEMAEFWREQSHDGSLQEMMLDENADELDQEERPEILAMLPDLSGKRVLELGAGIGRFTPSLAGQADHVTAVDFMEAFIKKNEETNRHLGNIVFLQADVTRLDLPPESVDVVFSNWLMMYLADEEVSTLAAKVLSWLTDGGYFFFRESCFQKSGNKKRSFNPTFYRGPADYSAIFSAVTQDARYVYEEQFAGRAVKTYIKRKNNGNQLCWLLKKVRRDRSDDVK
ncbi:PREDICTED: phosphoethanolamine N-methyltransferase-like [Branchiostoma belcheri]|uniref:phosphoethanolamine N-methyltransferase n=1 Tax=Branchiostoma belcheri TaxID=7741 RepID=A0A6P4ZU14_BRABE|nr:PREDICTED: phosphoethanolamine N-methyltransferase-like [Branchiostoma belcheri]